MLRDFLGFELAPRRPADPPVERMAELLVELHSTGPDVLQALVKAGAVIDPAYRAMVGQTGASSAYITARVPLDRLPGLWAVPAIKRWELGLAVERQQTLGLLAMDKERKHLPPVDGPVLAVIDFGCPFLHEQFRAHDGEQPLDETRIEYLWDQSPDATPGAGWSAPEHFAAGRVLKKATIDALLRQRALDARNGRPVVDETRVYANHRYLQDDVGAGGETLLTCHGVHVLDLAAGHPNPLPGTVADAAGRAPIIFVHLPIDTAGDSTGGSLGVRVLDALHFILLQTRDKVVVNISFGSQAGPHDGSSLLESAVDKLCQQHARLQVVVAAGNSATANGHARFDIPADGKQSIQFWLSEEDSNDGFVECWYPPSTDVEVNVQVTSPQGETCAPVASNSALALLGPTAAPLAAVIHRKDVAGGRGAQALLALAGRGRGHAADGAPAGLWQLTLHNKGRQAVRVDAWVERDDLPGRSAGQQLAFDINGPGASAITSETTHASLAAGCRTTVVGARSMLRDERLAYSAMDPTVDDRNVVKQLAAAEENDELPGLRAAAVRSTDSFRSGGTSAAAAVFSRSAYNAAVPPEKSA